MTRFLLDRDVMSQLDKRRGERNSNVVSWLQSVPDNTLFVSAITIVEAWKGYASLRRKADARPEKLRECDDYEFAFRETVASFAGRILPVDQQVAELWGVMLGRQDKHRFDACVAATAIANDMVVASRNTKDFVGRGARILDPFRRRPAIETPVM